MAIKDNMSDTQMKKGVLELCILTVLSKEEKYPSEIIEILKEKKLLVVEGTLYPLLSRLKNDKYLKYRWKESRSGPPRKYFSLTDSGKKQLEKLRTSWKALVGSVNQLLQSKK